MHFSNLDAYYHMASKGDKDAFFYMYNSFLMRAKSQTKAAGISLIKYQEISENFDEHVDNLFFKIINFYEKERTSFTTYVEYMIKVRLVNELKMLLSELKSTKVEADIVEVEHSIASDEVVDEDTPSLRRNIEISNFKYKIASGRDGIKSKKLSNKIMLLIYAGYEPSEIQKKLKISKSQYRTQISKIREDEDVLNLKLEIK